MDINQISEEVAAFVIPALPYIVKGVKLGGKKAAEKMGEIAADHSLDLGKKLWQAIRRQGAMPRKLSVAASKLAKTPNDQAGQRAFMQELTSLFQAKPELMNDLAALLAAQVPEQTVYAKKNVQSTVDQSVTGNGKQNVRAIENRGLVVRQNIKAKS